MICLEPRPWPRPTVGESLEFSAPRLLAELGVSLAKAGQRRQLFPKTSVRIIGPDEEFTVWPPAWFALPPISCSRRTYHTDRAELDQEILRLARNAGVEVRAERVQKVEHEGHEIESLVTELGTVIRAKWYVDASGHNARILGRSLGISFDVLGARRVARWARFREPPVGHETRLYFPEPDSPDLIWAWEIPLNDDEVSIGVVTSAERHRVLSRACPDPADWMVRCVEPFQRLQAIAASQRRSEYRTTAYMPFRYRKSIGPNWLLAGEASAMVDPLTSNGVTSALRHARSAANVITAALDSGRLRRRDRWIYSWNAPATIETLNSAIESFLYCPAVRQRLGLRPAVGLYAATGVITNSLYTRLDPTNLVGSIACSLMLRASRTWTRLASAAITSKGRQAVVQ